MLEVWTIVCGLFSIFFFLLLFDLSKQLTLNRYFHEPKHLMGTNEKWTSAVQCLTKKTLINNPIDWRKCERRTLPDAKWADVTMVGVLVLLESGQDIVQRRIPGISVPNFRPPTALHDLKGFIVFE